MHRLRAQGLVEPIREWIADGRPYLGICLGLQLLFDGSDEDGAETLGIVPGRSVLLEDAPTLPHIGWNQVEQRRPHPLFDGIPDGTDFYFVHSYAGRPAATAAEELTLAETVHGSAFLSALASGPVLGVQFHPERSGPAGLRLLSNFVRMAADATSRSTPVVTLARRSA
jgi:imidazole glycerol phosphate synthase glutamine amidotransferase subunit